MKRWCTLLLITGVLAATTPRAAVQNAPGPLPAGAEPPRTWIDPDTGHRIIRLTDEPGSASLYFNQNGYTADGKKMIYTTPEGISVLDLKTRVAKAVVPGRVRVIVAGRKTQNVYYTKEGAIWSTDVDSGATREIAKLPPRGSVATVNADETLLAGTYEEGPSPGYAAGRTPQPQPQPPPQQPNQPQNREGTLEQRFAARIPMVLFIVDVKTGEVRTIHKGTDWLNHLQFSPTDPTLLMFCHEGPWHKVERIWTIRADGSHLTKIHTRTMAMEIFGHEFWSADGKTIWYDLQTPRGEDFWLAGYNLETGARTWYHLQRNEWSIHFNVTRDGTLVCGDGGDEGQVARAPDGKWIYLFRPELIQNRGIEDAGFVKPGVLHAERLVNMSKHQYRLEPNVSFTPDQQWVVFRSNMFGPTYVFAVEVAKAGGSGSASNPRQ
jgi:oligogalacturonide lyase